MDRVVLITGASTGLGLELAKLFVRSGDRVYGTSLTQRNWPSAQKSLSSPFFKLSTVDGTSEKAVRKFISGIVKKEKRIDIVINNSGYANRPTTLDRETADEFRKNLEENLVTVFLMCRESLKVIKKRKKGLILNISSMAGVRAVPRMSAYSASKFGVLALTQAIQKENEGSGIKCLSICPGGMNTRMRAKVFGKADAARQQSAEFVAKKILQIVQGEIPVPPGGAVVIRHGAISAIYPLPSA